MNKKLFCFFAAIIILFGFVTRVYAIHNNNIFFTADEGRDAVYVRQIINYHQVFTKGPESSVRGIYTGPLWYYFIAIGYAIFNGNPSGAVFMLIVLNLAITLVLIYVLKWQVDAKIALITGFGLMVFWPFFNTSLYGFNPFPLVALSIILILLLSKNKYCLALLPILLAFNTELAGALAFLFFYIFVLSIFLFKRKIDLKKYLIFAFAIPGVGLIKILVDYLRQPKNTANAGLHVISGTNFKQMALEFWKMGILLIIPFTIMYLTVKNKNAFVKKFTYLTLGLIFISYLFFSATHGWREWQTSYISPLIFIATILMIWQFKKFKYFIIGVIFIFQFLIFKNNYLNYLKPSPDRSLLYNQIKVLDWVYTHNENNGFNLYTYTDSFYDYSYQYLISWYAKPKYGFYPCEYANFPLSIKALYIPGSENYVKPQLGCDKFRFLIIDSVTNGNANKNWINDFRNQTLLVTKTQIGNTTIEKRKVFEKIH